MLAADVQDAVFLVRVNPSSVFSTWVGTYTSRNHVHPTPISFVFKLHEEEKRRKSHSKAQISITKKDSRIFLTIFELKKIYTVNIKYTHDQSTDKNSKYLSNKQTFTAKLQTTKNNYNHGNKLSGQLEKLCCT